MLRSGRIVYTNDLPVYTAFDEGAVRFPGALVADVPANLNAMLLDGRLDLGPTSAAAYARNAEQFLVLPELCIGARNEVWSVVCVSRKPLGALDGARIAVTRESASGVGLLRVLLERRYGVRAEIAISDDPFAAAEKGEPALLIGDRAIDARERFPRRTVHDLGALWHEWTAEDMVFALWVVRRDVFASNRDDVHEAWQALLASLRWGAAHGDRVVAAAQRAHERRDGFYESYFATLNFALDARARSGLARYFAELRAAGLIAAAPALEDAFVLAR